MVDPYMYYVIIPIAQVELAGLSVFCSRTFNPNREVFSYACYLVIAWRHPGMDNFLQFCKAGCFIKKGKKKIDYWNCETAVYIKINIFYFSYFTVNYFVFVLRWESIEVKYLNESHHEPLEPLEQSSHCIMQMPKFGQAICRWPNRHYIKLY